MKEVLKFIYGVVLFQQAVFILFIIFKSRLKTLTQLIILLILLSLFFCASDRVINIYSSSLSRNLPWAIYILDTFNLLYLPLVYLFIKSITHKLYKLHWVESLHFAPFLYSFLLVLFCYTFKPRLEQLHIQQSFTTPGFFYTSPISFNIILYSRLLQIIYVLIAILYLYKFQLRVKKYSANVPIILCYLMIVLISFVVLWILGLVFHSYFEKYFYPFIDILIVGTSILFIYFGIKKPIELSGDSTFQIFKPAENYKDYDNYKLQLQNYITTSKVYLDSEITLNKLAEQSGISSRILSETINNCYHMHFFDFINSFRIEAAKEALKETDNSILEILYQVGFNSKSAFNRAFMKHAGTTPSNYRKSI